MSVSAKPGQTQLHLILYLANSFDNVFVDAITEALLEEYANLPGLHCIAALDERLTIEPLF